MLNDRLTQYTHLKHVLKKANIALIRIKYILRKRNGLDNNVKLLLYKQLIRPNLTYAFTTWFNITTAAMEKIRIFERKCLRLCVDDAYKFDNYLQIFRHISNNDLYNKCNILRIDHFPIELATKFITSYSVRFAPIISHCFNINDSLLVKITNSRYQCPAVLKYILTYDLHLNNDKIDLYNRSYVPFKHRKFLIKKINIIPQSTSDLYHIKYSMAN